MIKEQTRNRNTRGIGLFAMVIAISFITILGPSIAEAASNLLINPGFEEKWFTYNEAFEWQDFGLGYERKKSTVHSGGWSIKVTNDDFTKTAGAYQRVDLNQTTLKPVFIGGFVKGKDIVNSPGGFIAASIYAEIHLIDGTVVYWNSIANTGKFDWRWIGFNTGELTQVNKPISHIFVVPNLSYATGIAYFDDITVVEHTPLQSAVSIVFDDGEDSVFYKALPILAKNHLVASTAIIGDEVGDDGKMNRFKLHILDKIFGWEIISHTISHEDLTLIPTKKLLNRQLLTAKKRFIKWGFDTPNFATPFGAYNGLILGEAQRWYKSVRNYEQGDNPQGAFPYNIRVRGVLDTTTPQDVADWIAEAQAKNTWIVITFHEISDSGDDAFHTSPKNFKLMVDEIVKSGVDVVTYDQGLNLFATKI
jgi:peptidoglycan/xylan/chitin deacetylase (PgdA/CDA1 family)